MQIATQVLYSYLFSIILVILGVGVREGFKKSKWKFKMAFAMRGGGLEGVSSAIYLF